MTQKTDIESARGKTKTKNSLKINPSLAEFKKINNINQGINILDGPYIISC